MSGPGVCPDAGRHTPCPPGYLQWHAWAEAKARTHTPRRCPTCGLYKIWAPKGERTPARNRTRPTPDYPRRSGRIAAVLDRVPTLTSQTVHEAQIVVAGRAYQHNWPMADLLLVLGSLGIDPRYAGPDDP